MNLSGSIPGGVAHENPDADVTALMLNELHQCVGDGRPRYNGPRMREIPWHMKEAEQDPEVAELDAFEDNQN